jgi:hypothetical protein
VFQENGYALVINPKQVDDFINYGVKAITKYGTQQIFIVTSEKD